jgi:hypothetical protein
VEAAAAALERARELRAAITARLEEESEFELATAIGKCGEPLLLVCTACGHHHATETRCRQKWCPVCVRAIATKRSLKYAAAAAAMNWPLFITLTVQNVGDAGVPFVRKLRRDFGKLRHRKLWKTRVRGGVAAIEVTNKGKGWHPHLHALIDCEWLAIRTPKPQPGMSRDAIRHRCTLAKREFTALWKKISGEQHGVCWIQRTSGEECAREVLKYSVKGSDLAESPDAIGPLIHQLRATRLTTSFGTLFGKLRAPGDDTKPALQCERCQSLGSFVPEFIADKMIRS